MRHNRGESVHVKASYPHSYHLDQLSPMRMGCAELGLELGIANNIDPIEAYNPPSKHKRPKKKPRGKAYSEHIHVDSLLPHIGSIQNSPQMSFHHTKAALDNSRNHIRDYINAGAQNNHNLSPPSRNIEHILTHRDQFVKTYFSSLKRATRKLSRAKWHAQSKSPQNKLGIGGNEANNDSSPRIQKLISPTPIGQDWVACIYRKGKFVIVRAIKQRPMVEKQVKLSRVAQERENNLQTSNNFGSFGAIGQNHNEIIKKFVFANVEQKMKVNMIAWMREVMGLHDPIG